MPPVATRPTAKAAKAFVRYYIATINYAAATGDLELLHSLGTRDCASCQAIVHNIARIYRAGGSIKSHGWRLDSVRTLQVHDDEAALSLKVMLRPEVVVSRSGAEPERHLGARQPMTAFLTRGEHQWRVSRLDLVT